MWSQRQQQRVGTASQPGEGASGSGWPWSASETLGKPGVAQDKPLSFFLLSRRKPSLPTTLEPTCLTFFSNSHLTIASITSLRPVVCSSLKHSKALFFFSLTFFLASYPPDFLKTDSKINKDTASMETPDFEGASGEGRGWWWGGSTRGLLNLLSSWYINYLQQMDISGEQRLETKSWAWKMGSFHWECLEKGKGCTHIAG